MNCCTDGLRIDVMSLLVHFPFVTYFWNIKILSHRFFRKIQVRILKFGLEIIKLLSWSTQLSIKF